MVNLKLHINYWKISARRSWKTALDLYKTKHYDACLFFSHLAIEKSLKGLIVKRTHKTPPYIHDLARLANLAKIDLLDKQIQELRTITTFNIASRYDEVKLAFYKRCTPKFTKKYLTISRRWYLWLKKEFQKK